MLATKQKPFDHYRPAEGLGRVAEKTNIYFINDAKLLQICREALSVDLALECTPPTVSGVDLAEFSVGGARSVD